MEYIPPYGSTDPEAPFVDRDTATATRGSSVPAEFFNKIQAELLSVIDAAGLTRDSEALQLALAIQSGRMNYAEPGGTENALTVTLAPAPSVIRAGQHVLLKIATTNSDAMTLNVNGLGAVSIKRTDGGDTVAGDAVAGHMLPVVFDGSVWRIERSVGNNFLPLDGGTMTGPITLPGPPTADLHATTRAYVDHPGFVSVTAATTLTQSQLRKYVEVGGSGSYTIGLPAPAEATTTGGMYWLYNAGSSDKTLSTPSGNFVGPCGKGASTMTLPRGAFVWVIAGFDNWIVVDQSYSFSLITGATTLSPSALGGYIQLGGGSTYTVTLPNPSSFSGASLDIYNAGSIAYTLSTPGGGSFVGPLGSGGSTLSIPPGSYFTLRAGSVNWIVR